jgi:hypothetical protein
MKIENVAMYQDANGKWNLEVYVDETPNIQMEEIAHIGDSRFHYGENSDGFVRFGVSHDTPSFGHQPGYMWSSRPGVFNTCFGKDVLEVIVCTPYTRWGCYYMTADKLLELLPDDFHLSVFMDSEEWFYAIIQDGEPEEYHYYEYVCPRFRR